MMKRVFIYSFSTFIKRFKQNIFNHIIQMKKKRGTKSQIKILPGKTKTGFRHFY